MVNSVHMPVAVVAPIDVVPVTGATTGDVTPVIPAPAWVLFACYRRVGCPADVSPRRG
jgi:hypothetical protein